MKTQEKKVRENVSANASENNSYQTKIISLPSIEYGQVALEFKKHGIEHKLLNGNTDKINVMVRYPLGKAVIVKALTPGVEKVQAGLNLIALMLVESMEIKLTGTITNTTKKQEHGNREE